MSPMSGLTKDQIVGVALELVDEEGLEALQMRTLARRLGVTQGALYKHLPGKDSLLDAVLERLLGEVDTTPLPGATWREELTRLAHALRAALDAHRGLAGLLKTRDPMGENSMRMLDAWARALLDAGLTGDEAGHAWFTLVHYVIGFEATYALDGHNVRRSFDVEALVEVHRQFAALDADEYPGAVALGRHIWNPAAQERFDFGLALLLDGLEQRVETTATVRR
jgi:AcrR family transcriptional regulator